MSNRIERTQDKRTVEKHQKILKDLLQLPENKICADCKKRDPRWASANLGIFVCLRCSGVHRSLGVHISKVRSVDLDTWTPEHIEIMQRWGNARANLYWEHQLQGQPPVDDAKIESYIRNKYEYKKYVRPGPMPEPESLIPASTQVQQFQQVQTPQQVQFQQPQVQFQPPPPPQQQFQQAQQVQFQQPQTQQAWGNLAFSAPQQPVVQQQQLTNPWANTNNSNNNHQRQPSNGGGWADFSVFTSATPNTAPVANNMNTTNVSNNNNNSFKTDIMSLYNKNPQPQFNTANQQTQQMQQTQGWGNLSNLQFQQPQQRPQQPPQQQQQQWGSFN